MGSAAAFLSEDEFRTKLSDADRLMQQANAHINTLFERCNRAMHFLLPPVSAAMIDALNRLKTLVAELGVEMAKIFNNPGWPPRLWSTGNDWTSKVGGPVSDMPTRLGADQRKLDTRWQGTAADAYTAVVAAQHETLKTVTSITAAIDANLKKTMLGIIAMWGALLAALISFVLELASKQPQPAPSPPPHPPPSPPRRPPARSSRSPSPP